MTRIQWEKLAGDTDRFAVRMTFTSDPDQGQGIDPDASTSWGGFQLWVKGRNLCTHQEAGGRMESVHWYLLPLLEWLVAQWDTLMHEEERLPLKSHAATAWEALRETRSPPPEIEPDEKRVSQWESAWQRWWHRHSIRAAREGGLFPDVVIRRAGDEIEISWGNGPTQGTPSHFAFDIAAPGCAGFRPTDVTEPLYKVLSGAAKYLESRAPASERLESLNTQIRSLQPGFRRTDRTSPDTESSDR